MTERPTVLFVCVHNAGPEPDGRRVQDLGAEVLRAAP
jgi:hypothetical protein